MSIYLDNAAATKLDSEVLEAMMPYLTDKFYNPSALYMSAKSVSSDISAARASVAAVLGARPIEITFTAGGTEANNLAIDGVMQQYPGANIVVSSIEHESVLKPARQYDCREIPVGSEGLVDIASLQTLIDDKTVMVSVMYANNEIGTIQPLRDVAKIIKQKLVERRQTGNKMPLIFHTDACQAANYLDMHVSNKGIDMLTLNSSKLYGPKQSGALYVRTGVKLGPIIRGGGQELGLRSGTENVAGIIGFSLALTKAQKLRELESNRLLKITTTAIKLIRQKIPGVIINGSEKHRLPNNIHITIPGQDNERLIMELDERGILAAVGSACSASSDEPSHVLRAIGLPESAAQSSLRFTLGRETTSDMLNHAVTVLAELVA